jgi:hypothetical protein
MTAMVVETKMALKIFSNSIEVVNKVLGGFEAFFLLI